MLLAFDNKGNIWYALSTHNTNSSTFSVFMKHLADALDADRPGWRDFTVLLTDNASYHRSAQTLEVLERLELPIMFTGPYSFSIAACELLFSNLKRGALNPNELALGKRYLRSQFF